MRLELRVNELAVDGHIENAAGTAPEVGICIERLLELGGQTGCLSLIASGPAIDDLNLHYSPPQMTICRAMVTQRRLDDFSRKKGNEFLRVCDPFGIDRRWFDG